MSPTIETTASYKTCPHTTAFIAQFSPCATRAASPPESNSSDQSNGNSSVGVASDCEDDTAGSTKKRTLAGSVVHQHKNIRSKSQEVEQPGTGKPNDSKENPSTYHFDLPHSDHRRGSIGADRNSSGFVGAEKLHPSSRQVPRATNPGRTSTNGIDKLDSQTTFPAEVFEKTTSLSGLLNSPENKSVYPRISSPTYSRTEAPYPTQIGNWLGEEGRSRQAFSGDENVNNNIPASNDYAPSRPSTKMAAEGDNSQEEPKVKPRKKVTADPNHVSHQFFHLEPCVYSHRMFIRAAQIFSVLKQDDADTEENKALRRRHGQMHLDKGTIPDMDFMDAQEQIKTFELTFATLKFQKLFSSILDYIGFFHEFPDLRRLHSLCYVILYDLQTRKFQKRIPFPDEVIDPDCAEVEDAIHSQKTKLQANIAKERVKNHAPSIEYLLPEHIRNKDETKTRTPVYLWVNQFKSTISEAIENLKSNGMEELFGEDMSQQTGSVFCVDPHCSDLLTFPPHMDMEIKTWDSVSSGILVQQDKSSCLAPQAIPYVLGPDHDVIHVNVGTAMTTCHLASLLRHKCPNAHIFAFGVDSTEKARKVAKNFEFLGVKNIRAAHDEFLSVDPEDSRFKNVRVILISANCSKSAITSPVQFIVSEGEDTQILGKLSVGDTDMTMVGELMGEHERLLKHALRFPKLQAVVYTTRSRHEAENEVVVTKVLEYFNMTNGKRPLFKVVPPVIPFCVDEIDSDSKDGVDGRYIRFRPSDRANGCFVAIIAKEPEDPKDFGRTAPGKGKSKSVLNKTKSVASGLADGTQTSENGGKSNGKGNRKALKSGTSAPEMKTGSASSLKSKLSQHKSPAGVGARLYQAGLIKKMENGGHTIPSKPEHLKVVQHPAPFRATDVEDKIEQ